jgi:hypothetical protein
MNTPIRLTIVILVCLCALPNIAAAEPTPTTVKELALFKNGYGLFSCEGELPGGVDRIYLDRVPRAVLGTLWFGTSKDGPRLREAAVVLRESTLERPAVNFEELIRMNSGKQVSVTLEELHTGTLLPVPEAYRYPDTRFFNPAARRALSLSSHGRNETDRRVARPDHFLLESSGTILALPFSHLRDLRLPADSTTTYTETIEEPQLECALDKPGSGRFYMHYVQGGVGWTPAYEISLRDAEHATVRLKATLINDVEDLDAAEVRFIVGFPNFMFAHMEEPLSGRQSLQEFLEVLYRDPGERSRSRHAAAFQQSISNVSYFVEAESPQLPITPEGGEFKEDLFFYPPIVTSLKKGERASFLLSEDDATFEHVYTWEIPDTIPLNDTGYYQQRSQEERDIEIIWHALKLQNDSARPWTTAPALILRDDLPLGQDMLRYTSVGSETNVPITRATDVAGDAKEFEVDREHQAKRIYRNEYDRVRVRGELTIQNKRTEAIRAVITKSTTGEVAESLPEADVARRAEGLQPVNPRSTLTWEVDVLPGKEQTLTYVIDVYVRS